MILMITIYKRSVLKEIKKKNYIIFLKIFYEQRSRDPCQSASNSKKVLKGNLFLDRSQISFSFLWYTGYTLFPICYIWSHSIQFNSIFSKSQTGN